MSLGIDAVRKINGIAIVGVVPRPDRDRLGLFVDCWRALQLDQEVEAVAVISVGKNLSDALPTREDDLITIAPKSVGLLKPFGVGLRGQVCDYALQLVGEADVVVATEGVRISDTNVGAGIPAVNVRWLRGSLPDAEISRLSLLPGALAATRAAELGLVDEVVASADLEAAVTRRLRRFVGR
jgi:hypothetical protein